MNNNNLIELGGRGGIWKGEHQNDEEFGPGNNAIRDLYENLSEVQKSISGLPDIGRVIVDAFLDYIFTLFLGRD